MDTATSKEKGCSQTRFALLWMNLTSEPLNALYGIIPFLLRKDLDASTAQIALFTTLNPVLSVFSFYWGARLAYRQSHPLWNLIGAWVLARLPFCLFPFFHNFWFFLIACAIYQLFSRASTPALMEILKRNIPKAARETIFSFYFLLSVLEGVGLGLLLTKWVHVDEHNWKLLFLFSALISLSSILPQLKIKVPHNPQPEQVSPPRFQPIRESFKLLRLRPDFARFQWAFMVGGFALMVIAPVKSIFCSDVLSLSHADLVFARCVFIGIGLAGSSLLWRRGLERVGIERLTPWILLGFGLFPILLILTQWHFSFLFLSHFVYGIAQGGSHLLWHLSGTIFAGEGENSSRYTTVNVLLTGIRGAVGPFLGAVLSDITGPIPILVMAGLISIVGFGYFVRSKSRNSEKVAKKIY